METFHDTAQIRWSFSLSKTIVPYNKYSTVPLTEAAHFRQSLRQLLVKPKIIHRKPLAAGNFKTSTNTFIRSTNSPT